MLINKLSAHIQSVRLYRERLTVLQAVWDNLSLLSQMNGDGTDMQGTRTAFEQLSVSLLQQLAVESVNKTVQSMHGRAQVAIDVLVRNLFERTADIGFICADQEVQQYLLQSRPVSEEAQQSLRRRFAEYVAKYSVYEDVALLALDGTVLLQLRGEPPVARSADPLVKAAVAGTAEYLECFRHIDVFASSSNLPSLVYASRVAVAGKVLGVLCLKFRLQDEAQGIFRKLLNAQDWLVLCFLDANGVVLASSDPWQIPVGAHFDAAAAAEGDVQRFAGREYLAVTHAAKPYQGYAGPGWTCHALIPIEQACTSETAMAALNLPAPALAAVRRNAQVFAPQLQQIPKQAEAIQRELNRAVWNGHIHIGNRVESNQAFSKALLWEISHTGRKTQEVFEQSVSELERTVVTAIMHSSRTAAALAVDILDRNLYERANDCRWWALDRRLSNALSGVLGDASADVTQVLRQINRLYTVYHTLVLFDAHCKVVATSNEANDSLLGASLSEAWAQATLSLANSQSYHVSAFEPCRFYAQQNTWVYSAAIRGHAGRVVGGIGIVFDATPQLQAMLSDALMNTHPGSIALFASRAGAVLAATARYQPGDNLPLDRELLAPPAEGHTRLVALDGVYYAIGVQASAGYREYPGLQLLAIVMIPLGNVIESSTRATPTARTSTRRIQGDAKQLELATFYVGTHWLSVPAATVLEAINATQLRTMPEKVKGRAGYTMHAGQAVLVIDLAALLDSRASTTDGEIVLVRTPDNKVMGLLVDSLGEIPQVNLAAITPIADKLALTDRMVRGEQADTPLLLILNIERLVAIMTGQS